MSEAELSEDTICISLSTPLPICTFDCVGGKSVKVGSGDGKRPVMCLSCLSFRNSQIATFRRTPFTLPTTTSRRLSVSVLNPTIMLLSNSPVSEEDERKRTFGISPIALLGFLRRSLGGLFQQSEDFLQQQPLKNKRNKSKWQIQPRAMTPSVATG